MGYRIVADDHALSWRTENFIDSFSDLLAATADALSGRVGVVEFTDLPDAWRLRLRPEGDRLLLTLDGYRNWPILPSAVGVLAGQLDVRSKTFAGAVFSQGQVLGRDTGAYSHAARNEFPYARLAELSKALGR
jgi:hypothetical protein